MPAVETVLFCAPDGSTQTATVGGAEVANLASRRNVLYEEHQFVRLQYGADPLGLSLVVRIEYLNTSGSWVTLVPDLLHSGGAFANKVSDWILLPVEIAGESSMLRAILTGPGAVKITYIAVQTR